jgi:hypothetical protein
MTTVADLNEFLERKRKHPKSMHQEVLTWDRERLERHRVYLDERDAFYSRMQRDIKIAKAEIRQMRMWIEEARRMVKEAIA